MPRIRRRSRSISLAVLAGSLLVGSATAAPPAAGQAAPPPFVELAGSAVAVNGTYRPIVGNFTGDASDDILWYAPGSGAESLWRGTGDGSAPFAKEPAPQVNGTYTPVVGDFGADGRDDILWYAPGPAPDARWDFTDAGLVKRTISITGTFTPLVLGNAPNPDAVFWYAPGPAQDWLWTFPPGAPSHTSAPYRVDGSFRPIVGDLDDDSLADIFWYAPGSAPDARWRRTSTAAVGSFTSVPEPVNGTYVPLVGDVRQPSSTAQATTDIVWTTTTGSDQVWDRTSGTWSRAAATIAGPKVALLDLLGPDVVLSWGGTGEDRVWRGVGPTGDSSRRTELAKVPADAIAVIGRFGPTEDQQVLWYRPGPGAERFWVAPES